MIVNFKYKSLIDESPLPYVEYVATAPWNRPKLLEQIGEPPKFTGIGTQFILEVIITSFKLKMKGKIALHSLLYAEDFYRALGFIYYPGYKKESMKYFEINTEKAQFFLDKLTGGKTL